MSYSFYIFLLIFGLKTDLTNTLIASNKTIATGNVQYMCAFFRKRDLSVDDVSMPEILTFCSGSVIHSNWVLTARQCFVQKNWLISPITVTFTNELPNELHSIEKIYDQNELSLVRVSPQFSVTPIEISKKSLTLTTTCQIFGFSTPDNKPVQGHSDSLIYKVWHMEGDVIKANVEGLQYKECIARFGNRLSEYKTRISITTLCINALKDEYLEPCAFDRGAPIICGGKLQGVLVYLRSLPPEIPFHLPVGCYGYFNRSISIYAESITMGYYRWINRTLMNN